LRDRVAGNQSQVRAQCGIVSAGGVCVYNITGGAVGYFTAYDVKRWRYKVK
jgi:hypothetical protein